MPAGLTFNAGRRTISGTPTTEQTETTYTYTATDDDGTADTADDDTATLTFSITVSPASQDSGGQQPTQNRAPTAEAGPNRTVNTGTTATLNGSGSSDPDNDSLTYRWSQSSGATVTLSSTTAQRPTFTAPSSPTTLVFSLVVNDGTVDSTADTVSHHRAPAAHWRRWRWRWFHSAPHRLEAHLRHADRGRSDLHCRR